RAWRARSATARRETLRTSRTTPVGAAGRPAAPSRSAEDDGPVTVQQHAVLGVPAHGARQRPPLDVLAQGDEVLDRMRVVHALDVLLDDRALVQVARDVVRGRADELDAALVRLRVRPRALE